MNKLKLPQKIKNKNLLFFTLIFGVIGALFLGISSASTNPNPTGYADYCALEGNNTVIYGWGHDDDAPSGSLPSVTVSLGTGASVTVPTDRAGYYDSLINQYLTNNGYTPSDTYGFRAEFSGIYKGTSPTISGTVLNYGPGAKDTLHINETGNVAPYSNFAGSKVPDSCLASAPVPVLPQPTPTPTPTPKTSPRPTPRPVQQPSSAAPSISSDANATATAGTLTASIVVPTGNAATVNINYGSVDGSLTSSSTETMRDGDNAKVTLTGLQPKTLYYYQINRSNADKTTSTTSPTASFSTVGFDLLITPTDQSKPLSQLEMNISPSNTKAITDDSGQALIKDVSAGSYSLHFSYNNKDYSKDFVINSDSSEVADKLTTGVATFKLSISLAELTPASSGQPPAAKNKLNSLILLLIPLLLLILGATAWWLVRRRAKRSENSDLSYPLNATSEAVPPVLDSVPSQLPQPPQLPQQPQTQDLSNPNHIGESLKDMVIKSMREQAAKDANKKD